MLPVRAWGWSSAVPASVRVRGGVAQVAERLAENPHFVFADAQYRGYGVVEFTPGQLSTTLRAVEDVTNPVSGVKTLARFAVASGRPVIERV